MRKTHFILLSILSGVLLSFPWIAPWGAWALFIAFIPLFFNESADAGKVFLKDSLCLTYPAFFVWNVLSTWWIGYVTVAGMLFIVAANAFLMSLTWFAASRIREILRMRSGYFSLIVFWISFEFISHRGILPWPWLTLGNGLANSIYLIQWYEYTGVLGGSLWILLVNIFFFEAIKAIRRVKISGSIRPSVSLFLVLLLPILFSFYLYRNYIESGDIRHVVVLQPNVDPYTEKFNGMSEHAQIHRLVKLTEQSISDSTDLVVAPETAFPAIWEDSLVNSDLAVLGEFKKVVHANPEANFVVGAITKKASNSFSGSGQKYNSFNTAILISDEHKAQFSHKALLVAGFEKSPFREYFDFLPDFIINPGDSVGELTAGNSATLLEMNTGELAGPVICFESVFGNYVQQQVKNGAHYLVVLTNDGWWKKSAGVRQHFEYSKIRAIETRRSIVRSANTGISGFINQRGEVISKSNVSVTCAMDAKIKMNSGLTFYVDNGDYLGKGSMLLSFAVILYVFAIRRNLKT